ncbi:MAG: response regulator [Desulfamplus sp.]|nr:response regulator [Desulfamplus sp.]
MADYRILLVDDETIIINVISIMLRQEGYSIETACSGEDALKFIHSSSYDLIITDLAMDEVSGFEVLQESKKYFPETMVMLLTGHGELSYAVDAMRMGADDFLVKPAEPAILKARVEKCLEKRQTMKLAAKTEQAVHNMEKIFHKFEALSTMAGGIAHQFNNALAEILGNIELLKMDFEKEVKIAARCEKIKKSIEKMTRLTSQLLTYARGGSYRDIKISLNHFLQENISRYKDDKSDGDIELMWNVSSEDITVNIDKTYMELIFSAIFGNAREALKEKGSGSIKITTMPFEVTSKNILHYPGLRNGDYVCLKFEDNGPGMDENTRLRVMEPFFTTKFQGRGMGMAAAFGIVKHHKGWIYIDSELNKGTTVSVFLPRYAGESPSKGSHARGKLPHSGGHKEKGTVLIVEDEKMVMEVNFAILDILGYHVLTAGTAAEALHRVKKEGDSIDVILLDVILPDMSAQKLLSKLKAITPEARIIICSGYTLDEGVQELLDQGAHEFLKKPFSIARISEALSA